MFFEGHGVPLPSQQDVLATAVSSIPRDRVGSSAPLAPGQACAGRSPAAPLGRPRHYGHVLHPRLQRQPKLTPHTIAITPELLRRGTVQDTDIEISTYCCLSTLFSDRCLPLSKMRIGV